MSWIGAVVGAASSAAQAYGNYRFNYLSQYHNWKWQKEAMQNRHQWEVADLRKAGLNPILSANQGASTGGLNAGGSAAQMPDVASSAFQGLQMENVLKQQEANIFNTSTQSTKNQAEATTAVDLGNLYRTQQDIAKINAAKGLYEMDYLMRNPDVYDAIMKGKVGNSIPGLAAIGEDVVSGVSDSLRGVGKTISNAASDLLEKVRSNLRTPK